MHSLRSHLLVRTAALLALTLSVAAVAIYVLMRASLLSEFDKALLVEARYIASQVEQSGHDLSLEFEIGELPEYARATHPHYFQIWSQDGKVQAKSQSLGSENLVQPSVRDQAPEFKMAVLPNALSGRQVAMRFKPRLDDEGTNGQTARQHMSVVVAKDTTDLESTLRTLGLLLLCVSMITIVGSIALLVSIVKRGLRPLNTLASSIERVGANDLSERVELKGAPTEMVPVVQRLNDLLKRLDATLAREKAFTADVAHELRTPLAGLQTALEVSAGQNREPNEYRRTIEQCLRVTERMRAMVNDLLTMARAESRQLAVETEPVEIGELLQECWMPFESVAKAKSLDVQWRQEQDCPYRIDREKMKLVLQNLFENAVTYVDRSGWIRTTAKRKGPILEVTISNSGCDLRVGDTAHLFERFWRSDKARSEAALHCGLGLPLCQKVMEVLGGSIDAETSDGVFTVRVAIPVLSEQMMDVEASARAR